MIRHKKLVCGIVMVIIALSVYVFDTPEKLDVKLPFEIHSIDVGQADSHLIFLPNDKVMLIDAGNNADSETIIEYIDKYDVRTIDYLVATHPHEDHIGSMDDIVTRYEIGEIIMPRVQHTSDTYYDLLSAISFKNLSVTPAEKGYIICKEDDLKIEIISDVKETYQSLNEYSVVIKLSYKDISCLFMGDAEAINEKDILPLEKVDILKVGHHGSDTSSSEEFISSAKPTFAIIPVGEDNDYNHPSDKIIKRLKSVNSNILRTDKNGTIIIRSDGAEFDVEVEKQ